MIDSYGYLNPQIEAQLTQRSLRSGVHVLSREILYILINIINIIILSRLLTPNDFGLVAMVSVFTNFIILFKDIGIANAVVQKKIITPGHASTLFWITISISVIFVIISILLSPLVASFFNEPRIIAIIIVSSTALLINGFSILPTAIFKRRLEFFLISKIQIFSQLIASLSGICIAFSGAGYWALVSAQLIGASSTVLFTWRYSKWRPEMKMNIKEILPMISFGLYITGFNIVNFFSRNLDQILIGKFLDIYTVGLYNRAYRIMMLPIQNIRTPLNQVALPALSKLKMDPQKFKHFYCAYIELLSYITIPLMVFLSISSYEIIYAALGEQWLPMVPYFSIFAIYGLIFPVASTRGTLLISLGKTQKYFIWGLINSICISASVFIGLKWGAIGIAASYTATNYLILFPSLYFCYAKTPITVKNFIESIITPLFISVISGLIIIILDPFILIQTIIIKLFIKITLFCCTFIAVSFLIPSARKKLISNTQNIYKKIKER